MLAQLYTLLGTFNDQLLLIRLVETVCGAMIGILVSLVVLPTHSRATLRVARQKFMEGLGDLLDACAATIDGMVPERDLMTLTVALDASGRQLVQIRRAMTNGRLFGADRAGLRHRISLLGSSAASARELAATISATGARSPDLAAAVKELAIEARRLADVPDLGQPPPLPAGTVDILSRVGPLLDQARGVDAASVSAMRRLSEALALLGRSQQNVTGE
jgi:hypothetical protein